MSELDQQYDDDCLSEDRELNVTKDMQKEALKIKEHFKPDSYKEKADLHTMQSKIKKALAQVLGEKTSTTKRRSRGIENAPDQEKFKVAGLHFQTLLNELDGEHHDFVRMLNQSPGLSEAEKEQMCQLFNDNYTQKLDKLNLVTEMNPIDYSIERELLIMPSEELDKLDKRHVKQQRFDVVGVQPKVETKLPLTEEQKLLRDKKNILEVRERDRFQPKSYEKEKKIKASKARDKRQSQLWDQVIEEYKEKLSIKVEPLKLGKVRNSKTSTDVSDKSALLDKIDRTNAIKIEFNESLLKDAFQKTMKKTNSLKKQLLESNLLNEMGKKFIEKQIDGQDQMLDAVQGQIARSSSLDKQIQQNKGNWEK